jgi:hypothetical protein
VLKTVYDIINYLHEKLTNIDRIIPFCLIDTTIKKACQCVKWGYNNVAFTIVNAGIPLLFYLYAVAYIEGCNEGTYKVS